MIKKSKQIIKYVTIGEIFSQYNSWIGWFGLMWINYFSNCYLIKIISGIQIIPPNDMCKNMIQIIKYKIDSYNLIIRYSLIFFVILFLSEKYLKKCFGPISFEHIFGIMYLYSTFAYSSIRYYNKVFGEKLPVPFDILNLILSEYFILEIILLMIIGLPIMLVSIVLIEQIIKKIFTWISGIKIEYTENNVVQIEKLV